VSRIEYLTNKVIEGRAYIADCLTERKLFEASRVEYEGTYFERRNDFKFNIMASLNNVKSGVYSTLFENVEHITMGTEANLAKLLGCPSEEPFIPFIDKYLYSLK
jgi:hypothetical protein